MKSTVRLAYFVYAVLFGVLALVAGTMALGLWIATRVLLNLSL